MSEKNNGAIMPLRAGLHYVRNNPARRKTCGRAAQLPAFFEAGNFDSPDRACVLTA
jgi:hypothetical protein